jgi:dsDNA-binding SOS-regulon protein
MKVYVVIGTTVHESYDRYVACFLTKAEADKYVAKLDAAYNKGEWVTNIYRIVEEDVG